LIVDYRFDPLFPIAPVMLPGQQILWSKFAKSDYSSLFVAVAFQNGLQYRHSDLQMFICNDLAILFVNLVNVGPVTSEFKIGNNVHPVVSFFVFRQIILGSTRTILPHFHRMVDI